MLKVGESLYLERNGEDGNREKFKTILVDKNDKEILIEVPIHEETKKFGLFQVGETLDCYIYAGGKVYIFKTTLLERMQEKVPLLVFSFPGMDQMEVIQRRQHVRVNANLDIAVHSLKSDFQAFRAMTLDISGGGCAVILPSILDVRKLGADQEVNIWLVLPLDGKYHYVSTHGKLVRVFEQSGQKRASFRFVNISNTDRMQIIRYCFQREVQLKRK